MFRDTVHFSQSGLYTAMLINEVVYEVTSILVLQRLLVHPGLLEELL